MNLGCIGLNPFHSHLHPDIPSGWQKDIASVHPLTPTPMAGGGWGEWECINNPAEFHIFFTTTFALLNFPKGTLFNRAGPPQFKWKGGVGAE